MADYYGERLEGRERTECTDKLTLGENRLVWKSYGGELDWPYCRDGKYRPIESGIKPLVDGVPRGMVHSSDPRNTQEARAMRLKGYGNAIVPQVAAEFIRAFMALHAC